MKNRNQSNKNKKLLLIALITSPLLGALALGGVFYLGNVDNVVSDKETKITQESNFAKESRSLRKDNEGGGARKEQEAVEGSYQGEGIQAVDLDSEGQFTYAEKEEGRAFKNPANYVDENGNLPLLLFVESSNLDHNREGVALDQRIKFNLSRPVSRNLIIPQIRPEVIGNWCYSNEGSEKYLYRTLTFVPEEKMEPATKYRVILRGTSELGGVNRYFNYQLTFRTRNLTWEIVSSEANFRTSESQATVPEEVVSFGPTGGQAQLNQKVKIVFREPMQRESVKENFAITPVFSGSFQWSADNKELHFTPQVSFERETTFRVLLKKEALNEQGKPLSCDLDFSFQTVGKVLVTKFSPRNGSKNLSLNTPIKFYFNQPVDPESARSHFRIIPDIEGTITFPNQQVLVFQPRRLNYQTAYRVKILAGVKAIDLPDPRFDSVDTYGSHFQTKTQTILLNVFLDYQDYPLSCEAAALKMALAFKGRRLSENSILGQMRHHNAARWGDRWGDPFREFVGSLYGRQNSTGYGVYWQPISKAARRWRHHSSARSFQSITELTSQIRKGNLVVVWGTIGSWARPDGWWTRSGKYIPAWVGEHARTVTGFVGGPVAPKYIIVNDPIAGKIYWRTSSFLKNWRSFGFKGVIVK